MHVRNSNIIYAVAALSGIAAGLLSTHTLLAGTWWNLVFWALIGMAIGVFTERGRKALWTGMIYGIFLTISFLLSGFQGTADKIPAILLLTLGLCIPGALGGWLSVWLGTRVRR